MSPRSIRCASSVARAASLPSWLEISRGAGRIAELLEQAAGAAGVLAGDEVGGDQRLAHPRGDVVEIADWRRADDQLARHQSALRSSSIRASAAAPIIPASLPSSAARIGGLVHRRQRPGAELARGPGRGAGPRRRSRRRRPRSPRARRCWRSWPGDPEPGADQVEDRRSRSRRRQAPASVTAMPVDLRAFGVQLAPVPSPARAFGGGAPSRPSAVPEASASTQPRPGSCPGRAARRPGSPCGRARRRPRSRRGRSRRRGSARRRSRYRSSASPSSASPWRRRRGTRPAPRRWRRCRGNRQADPLGDKRRGSAGRDRQVDRGDRYRRAPGRSSPGCRGRPRRLGPRLAGRVDLADQQLDQFVLGAGRSRSRDSPRGSRLRPGHRPESSSRRGRPRSSRLAHRGLG